MNEDVNIFLKTLGVFLSLCLNVGGMFVIFPFFFRNLRYLPRLATVVWLAHGHGPPHTSTFLYIKMIIFSGEAKILN